MSERIEDLPVAVIGGGPVGLAAAAQLAARGLPMRVYEAGETVAANVRSWGHVRLFSFWRYNMDEVAKGLLREHGWQEPEEDGLPTGNELCDAYLEPLAEIPAIGGAIETRTRVRAITRQGIDKVTSRNRARHPFALMVENQNGTRIDLARAVIDASGTWQNQNPLGVAGIPATGEAGQRAIVYGIPDILGRARADYARKRVLVIGGGHSAANALLDLARLAETDHSLQLTWAVRSTNLVRVFGGGADDQLPARGKLGSDLKQLVDGGRLQLVKGFHAEEVTKDGHALVVTGHLPSGRLILGPVDRIIVATGQRPDLDMTRELRLDFDPWLESSRALGPSIDPNLHSCGSVPPHGYRELAHPDPGYFSVGIKSYGRAPTFLLATGHEQVRSVVAHLAGDEAAAIDVRLTLPETGVCSTDIGDAGDDCCGGPAPEKPDACCVADAIAKAADKTGCGCG
jgi:hypothetical protein